MTQLHVLWNDDHVVQLAAAALGRCGHEVRYGLSGGAADANVFNERGLSCLNLTHGVHDFHSPDERIAVSASRTARIDRPIPPWITL